RECWGPPASCRHRIVTVFALSNLARQFGATSACLWEELRRGRAFIDALLRPWPSDASGCRVRIEGQGGALFCAAQVRDGPWRTSSRALQTRVSGWGRCDE